MLLLATILTMPKTKITLSKAEKHIVCEHAKAHPDITQALLATWCINQFKLDVPPSQVTISQILHQKTKYKKLTKDEKGKSEKKKIGLEDLE